jgi:hypothetical protein
LWEDRNFFPKKEKWGRGVAFVAVGVGVLHEVLIHLSFRVDLDSKTTAPHRSAICAIEHP